MKAVRVVQGKATCPGRVGQEKALGRAGQDKPSRSDSARQGSQGGQGKSSGQRSQG
jgi:hypothetical protein